MAIVFTSRTREDASVIIFCGEKVRCRPGWRLDTTRC